MAAEMLFFFDIWSFYVSLWGDVALAALSIGVFIVFAFFAIFKMDIIHALTIATTPFTLYTVVGGVYFPYVTPVTVILYGILLFASLRRLYNATG